MTEGTKQQQMGRLKVKQNKHKNRNKVDNSYQKYEEVSRWKIKEYMENDQTFRLMEILVNQKRVNVHGAT